MLAYFNLFEKNPGFFRLWLAQAISLLGDWFTTIALSTMVAAYSNGSGLALSGLLISRFAPPLLVGPFAGVLVDRLDRKRLLIISDLARTGIVLFYLLAASPDRLWLIYVLSAIQFSVSALFEPARSALIPSVVKEDADLVRANTLGSVTWSAMLAVGAVIGGAVTAVVGNQLALIIDAATFAASAALILTISVPHETARQRAEAGWKGLVEGLRYALSHPATAAVLLVKLGGNIGNADLLMVVYATQFFVLGVNGSGSLGILYGAFGAGALLGPIVLNRFNNGTIARKRRLIAVGYVWIFIGWLLLGAAPTLALAVLAVGVKAMGSSIYWTYSSVILQETVPDHFLGRLFSLDFWGFQISTTLSVLITGWVVENANRLPGVGLSGVVHQLQTGILPHSAAQSAIRTIVFCTGLFSLIPLVAWTLALPWMERQRASQRSVEPAVASGGR